MFIQKDSIGLSCGHEYCENCWRQYVSLKITDDGGADSISCPGEKCGIIVDDDTIMRLISDESVRQKYQHLTTNSFVTVSTASRTQSITNTKPFQLLSLGMPNCSYCIFQHNHSLRWCPGADCSLAVKVKHLLAYKQKCTCTCGHSFCFNCGADCHDPISCSLIAKW